MIIYLPNGPLFASSTNSAETGTQNDSPERPVAPQRALASASLATVVTVNYRLHRDTEDGDNSGGSGSGKTAHKYPTPVHDTLAGFDWISRHLKPSQLCVYGTHIGGSLAMMLALTEPLSLRAIAAKEPMCDWVGLDDYCQMAPETDSIASQGQLSDGDRRTAAGSDESSATDGDGATAHHGHRKRGRKKKQAPPDVVPLLESRTKLFPKPANYFDPFASPALFLRSAGKDCPKSFLTYLTGPEYPVPILQRPHSTPEDEEWYSNLFATDPDVDMLPEGVESPQSPSSDKDVRRRKSLSRWPPYGLDYGLESYGLKTGPPLSDRLVLPDVRIFVHDDIAHDGLLDADAILGGQVISRSPSRWETTSYDESSSAAGQTQTESTTETPSESTTETDTDPKDEDTGKPRRAPRGSLGDVSKSMAGDTVLARQGAEMVSLMHHACFWGHPSGFGEDRVRMVRVPHSAEQIADTSSPSSSSSSSPGAPAAPAQSARDEEAMFTEKIAGKWFHHVFQEKK